MNSTPNIDRLVQVMHKLGDYDQNKARHILAEAKSWGKQLIAENRAANLLREVGL